MKRLQANLDQVKKLINEKDFDWLHVVEGYEGNGKSTLAIQICKYVDPSFSAHRIVFTPDQFTMLLKKIKKGSAVLIDEGGLMLFSRNSMQGDNINLIQHLTTIRAKNLFICICTPTITIVDKYVREHRIRSMTRVVRRGCFYFYSRKRILQIYQDPKTKEIIYPKPNFIEGFPKLGGADWREYTKKKGDVLDRLSKWFSTGDLAKRCHVTSQTIRRWCEEERMLCEKTDAGQYRISSVEAEKVKH